MKVTRREIDIIATVLTASLDRTQVLEVLEVLEARVAKLEAKKAAKKA